MLEIHHLLNWSMLLQTGGQRSQQPDGKAVNVSLTYATDLKMVGSGAAQSPPGALVEELPLTG